MYPDGYKYWSWPALWWLCRWLVLELDIQDGVNCPEGVSKEDRVDIQPMMTGYSLQIDSSDIFYNISHEEVVDGNVKAEWVIKHILSAKSIPLKEQGEHFQDLQLTTFHTLMLNMTRILGQSEPLKKRGSKKRLP